MSRKVLLGLQFHAQWQADVAVDARINGCDGLSDLRRWLQLLECVSLVLGC